LVQFARRSEALLASRIVRRAATSSAALLAPLLVGLCLAPAAFGASPGSAFGARAAHVALRELGDPYTWGGSSPAGFDCSGFTRWVYGRLGVELPHQSGAQWGSGRHVHGPPHAGDLVFFAGLTHVGIALGNGRFVHAPHSGSVVQIDSLGGDWYAETYDGAVRLREPRPAVAAPPRHRVWRQHMTRLAVLG
jgi:peptidoglycan DL-endopeptidase CwlO